MALKGVRVIEMAGLAPVPYCAQGTIDFSNSNAVGRDLRVHLTLSNFSVNISQSKSFKIRPTSTSVFSFNII